MKILDWIRIGKISDLFNTTPYTSGSYTILVLTDTTLRMVHYYLINF